MRGMRKISKDEKMLKTKERDQLFFDLLGVLEGRLNPGGDKSY